MKTRANWIRAPHFFNLDLACRYVCEALGVHAVYLVGSSLQRRDYGDVDVRALLDDKDFDRLFPCGGGSNDAFWSLVCASFSAHLAKASDLPVDFQIQRARAANEEFPAAVGPRCALGVFHAQPGDW